MEYSPTSATGTGWEPPPSTASAGDEVEFVPLPDS